MAVSDGMKEIFIATKDHDGNQAVCQALNRLKKAKKIAHVSSLETWIKVRNEAQLCRSKQGGGGGAQKNHL